MDAEIVKTRKNTFFCKAQTACQYGKLKAVVAFNALPNNPRIKITISS